MSNDITDTVSEFIHLNFVLDDRRLEEDEPLIDGDVEVIDSGAILELLLFLEERFAIAIEDDDVTHENFGSIAAIAALVGARLAAQQAPLGAH